MNDHRPSDQHREPLGPHGPEQNEERSELAGKPLPDLEGVPSSRPPARRPSSSRIVFFPRPSDFRSPGDTYGRRCSMDFDLAGIGSLTWRLLAAPTQMPGSVGVGLYASNDRLDWVRIVGQMEPSACAVSLVGQVPISGWRYVYAALELDVDIPALFLDAELLASPGAHAAGGAA